MIKSIFLWKNIKKLEKLKEKVYKIYLECKFQLSTDVFIV